MATLSPSETLREMEMLYPGDERWHLVLRILGSPQFRRAPRLREFLIYVCERAVRGDIEGLNEHQIGHLVFDRPKGYSPSEDNVVRAHARQVRAKLAEYFAESGRDEPMTIEIPKGCYVPVFKQRQPETADADADPSTAELPEPATLSGSARMPAGIVMILLAVAVVLGLGGTVYFGAKALGRARPPALASSQKRPPSPLTWMFEEGISTTIVVADTSFGFVQDLQGRVASLDEYLSPNFFLKAAGRLQNGEVSNLIRRLGTRQVTSLADLILSEEIIRSFPSFQNKISIRSARDLRARDLAAGNFIFLGSAYSNPWVSLFSRHRNFMVSLDPQTRRGTVINKTPHTGEQSVYVMTGEDGKVGLTYGVITFLPAEAETGKVLIIEGINMEGTEAAGTHLINADKEVEMRRAFGGPGATPPKQVEEVLLETKALAGATRDTHVVAMRLASTRVQVK